MSRDWDRMYGSGDVIDEDVYGLDEGLDIDGIDDLGELRDKALPVLTRRAIRLANSSYKVREVTEVLRELNGSGSGSGGSLESMLGRIMERIDGSTVGLCGVNGSVIDVDVDSGEHRGYVGLSLEDLGDG